MERKTNWIGCLLYIITVGITLVGLLYFISDFLSPYENDKYFGIYISLSIVGFLLLAFILISLIHYYFRDDAKKWNESTLDKVGHDITRLLSWPFSVNGFLFIILCAIVALVIFFICRSSGCCCGDTINELELTAITITITLAGIIPTIITKILAKNEIDSIIDKRLEKHITNIKRNHDTTLKETAHSSRMFSTVLYQMAEQLKQEADTSKDDERKKDLYKQALKKIVWSIGWGTKAISQYLLIKDTYPQGITKFSKEILTDYIFESQEFIKYCDQKLKDLDIEERPIRPSDLKSIFQVHALIKIHGIFKGDIELKDKTKVDVKNMLEEFEKLLIGIVGLDNIPKAQECKMTELDDEDNEKLVEKAQGIIGTAEEEAKKAQKEAEKKAKEEENYKKLIEESRKKVDAIV